MTEHRVIRSFKVVNLALGKTCGHTHAFPALIKCLCRHNRINEGWEITYDEQFYSGTRYVQLKQGVRFQDFTEEIKKDLEKHYKNYRMAHTLNLPENLETSLTPRRNGFKHEIWDNQNMENHQISCAFCKDQTNEIFIFDKNIQIQLCKQCVIEFREYLNFLNLYPTTSKTTKNQSKKKR